MTHKLKPIGSTQYNFLNTAANAFDFIINYNDITAKKLKDAKKDARRATEDLGREINELNEKFGKVSMELKKRQASGTDSSLLSSDATALKRQMKTLLGTIKEEIKKIFTSKKYNFKVEEPDYANAPEKDVEEWDEAAVNGTLIEKGENAVFVVEKLANEIAFGKKIITGAVSPILH